MNPLDNLAHQLRRLLVSRPPADACWRDPHSMTAALARIRHRFGDRLHERSGSRTNRCLLAFRLTPDRVPHADLKLICRAIARPADWSQRRLIDDDRLLAALLAQVDALRPHPHRHLACLRALETARRELQMDRSAPARPNLALLDRWLATNLPDPEPQPVPQRR